MLNLTGCASAPIDLDAQFVISTCYLKLLYFAISNFAGDGIVDPHFVSS